MTDHQRRTVEAQGWSIFECEVGVLSREPGYEISKLTSSGVEFCLSIPDSCFADRICDYAETFDVNSHFENWRDYPGTRAWADNVCEIKDMVDNLAHALKERQVPAA